MIFTRTPIPGVVIVESDPTTDHRGWFARTFCEDEFRTHGIDTRVAQSSAAYSESAGTLRGLHYQREPFGETKLVRCVRGRLFDVSADLRERSPTFGEVFTVELSDDRLVAVAVPPGVAHGYLTLLPHCMVGYQMSTPYRQDASTGIRWDDPDLSIPWPIASPRVISEQDRSLPHLASIDPRDLPTFPGSQRGDLPRQ